MIVERRVVVDLLLRTAPRGRHHGREMTLLETCFNDSHQSIDPADDTLQFLLKETNVTARGQSYLIAIGLVAGSLAPSPTRAEPLSPDAEAAISASLEIDTGVALARRQAAENDVLGAVGTVERVLIGHPDAIVPRLLYAGLLCRLDDPKGAAAELALLGRETVADQDWAEVTRACGAMSRPGTGEARP